MVSSLLVFNSLYAKKKNKFCYFVVYIRWFHQNNAQSWLKNCTSNKFMLLFFHQNNVQFWLRNCTSNKVDQHTIPVPFSLLVIQYNGNTIQYKWQYNGIVLFRITYDCHGYEELSSSKWYQLIYWSIDFIREKSDKKFNCQSHVQGYVN